MSDFKDPLDDILKKHKDSAENRESVEEDEEVVDFTPAPSQFTPEPVEETADEDIYGDNDLQNEIKQENLQAEKEHEERVNTAKESMEEYKSSFYKAPDRSLDQTAIDKNMAFQEDHIKTVNLMVEKVLAEQNIYDGYFPSDKRKAILGDLIEQYFVNNNSEEPNEEFKRIVLTNWISPENIQKNESNDNDDEKTPAFNIEDIKEYLNNGPVVTIKNTTAAPITINVDDSIIPEISETRKVEINIINVEEKEGSIRNVVENVDVDAFLLETKPTEINNVPVTLLYSAYRANIKPMNWFDYLKLASPTSHNPSDSLMQRWSNIYDHLLSTSIGNFDNFDDFLKHTMWEDLDLFEWALFVATSADTETISYTCNHKIGTKKVEKKDENGNIMYDENNSPIMVDEDVLCKNEVRYSYNPRSIIELKEDKLPSYYKNVHESSNGEQALELHTKIIHTKQQLTLPDSKFKINISHASAYDYINKKLPIVVDLCKEYKIPFDDFERYMSRNPVGSLYILCALGIDAIIITRNDTDYTFTEWEKIRKLVDVLSNDDIQVLMKVFEERNEKPFDFNFHNIECSSCHHVTETLPVGDIFELLGFNLTRRLQNTEINLIDIASN